MMKKLLSALLAAILSLTLGACSPKALPADDPGVTLTFWHVYGEQADSAMNTLVDTFNNTVGQEEGIVVSVTNVSNTSAIGSQLLQAQSQQPGAPAMPDLFTIHSNTAAEMGIDRLIDWTEYFTPQELEGYVPEFIRDGTLDGSLCVFPVSKSSYALFINGSQFERFSAQCAVNYEDLSTWEGFFQAAGTYYDWSGGKAFCAMDYLLRHVELDMLSAGEEPVYTAQGWYDTASPALRESWMRFALPLVQGHIKVSDLYANTQVMTGETLCGIGSTAAIAYYNDTVTYPDNTTEPTNLMVLPLPRSEGDQHYMPQTGVGLSALQTTPEKAQAAAVFVRWLTQAERNLDFAVQTGYMPVRNDAFHAIDSYSYPDEGTAHLYSAIRDMRSHCTAVVRPSVPGYYAKVDALYEQLRHSQEEYILRCSEQEPALVAELTWQALCSLE